MRKLLVIGADIDSLGAWIVKTASDDDWGFDEIVTAGISNEDYPMNVVHSVGIRERLADIQPSHIICTVGVNDPASIQDPYLPTTMNSSFAVNCIGPMEVLRHFLNLPAPSPAKKVFVAISSNSAHIARRGSIAYCATKAALSMALRVAAREEAGKRAYIWGYELGLLAGTPMTNAVAERYPNQPISRIPGAAGGLSVGMVADKVLSDVAGAFIGLNGCMIRMDGGDQ